MYSSAGFTNSLLINCGLVCVFLSQWKVFRLWCSCGMLRPEAAVQTDPALWLQSPRFLFLSRPEYPTPHLSWCLFSLPTRWLRSPSAEDDGSEGTLHESRPTAFPVWRFRASVRWGERVATGHQEEHSWYGHGGWEALHQPQVVTSTLTTVANPNRGRAAAHGTVVGMLGWLFHHSGPDWNIRWIFTSRALIRFVVISLWSLVEHVLQITIVVFL